MIQNAEHLASHGTLLPDDASAADVMVWVARARECAVQRCELLRSECEAVDDNHRSELFKAFALPAQDLSEPGQLATLVGGAMRLLKPTITPRPEIWWWRNINAAIRSAPRCRKGAACPDCEERRPCPLDVAHEYVALSLLSDNAGHQTDKRINGLIMKTSSTDSYLGKWSENYPVVAGHVAYLCIKRSELAGEHGRAETYSGNARRLDLHLVEPHLTIRHAQTLLGQQHVNEAEAMIKGALIPGSTNPSQEMLRAALIRIASFRAQDEHRKRGEPDPQYVLLRRPADRVRTRRFS
ncbi:hypothetical protein QN367_10420 [Cryobacterium sp. RTS3]|uniref:hypothetical protein n=1 Tax=Cryobacterium sp. RTS3 TaxID=3048643 RepID=UPI002B2331B3|nr:hypothetical protein [Cryobacterium sp. RTS3]MEA9999515.1 hypothetical protein [Cryobacterium sp. RTS3]